MKTAYGRPRVTVAAYRAIVPTSDGDLLLA
jgi:hypothetical protein